MNRAERQEVAWSLEKLRAAEARLADAVQCGDTHDACVEALALIREAISPNDAPPPGDEKAGGQSKPDQERHAA